MTQLPSDEDLVGRYLGWIDYPSDSIEHGRYWHLDPQTAPLGRSRIHKSAWRPRELNSDSFKLAVLLGLQIIPYPIYESVKYSVLVRWIGSSALNVPTFEVIRAYGGRPQEATREAVWDVAVLLAKDWENKVNAGIGV